VPVAVASLFVGAWFVWCYFNKTTANGLNTPFYTSYLGHLNQVITDLQAQTGSTRIGVIFNVVLTNFIGGILIALPMVTSAISYKSFDGLSSYIVLFVIFAAILIFLLIVMGFWRALSKRARLLHVYVAASLGLYLIWLPDVSYDRFLMPLLPFFLLF